MFKSLNKYLGLYTGMTVLLLYILLFSVDYKTHLKSWVYSQFFQYSSDGSFLFYLFKQTQTQNTFLIFLTILIMFVTTYFLEKRKALFIQVVGSGLLILMLLDLNSLIVFLSGHLIVHSVFHGIFSKSRYAEALRQLVVQAPLFYIVYLIAINIALKENYTAPLAILFFCWQWVRLYIYSMDYREGFIPKSLYLLEYLSVFMSPGSIVAYDFGHYIGQGYQYTVDRFRNGHYDRIVLGGAKLLAIALIYILFARIISVTLVKLCATLGVPVSQTVAGINKRYVAGENLSGLTILLSCLLGQINWFVLFAGVLHAKIGLWRLFGYNFEPQFNKFWKSTNMVSLWQRYTYHFRLTLLRVAYFPTFFFFRKKNYVFRLTAATFASAGIVNMCWAHIPAYFLYFGFTIATWDSMPTWPYYFLLSFGILICEIYLLKIKQKTPKKEYLWEKVLNGFGFAVTFAYFSLIHIFARPVAGGSLQDYTVLFMKGLGLSIFLKG